MIKWIVEYAKCMNIHLAYQGEGVEVRIIKGCPQGGVLSTLLWRMVVDSLFLKLNAKGYTAQAYADDLAIVIGVNTLAQLQI